MGGNCIAPRMEFFSGETKVKRQADFLLVMVLFLGSLLCTSPIVASAAQELTQILGSKSFQGSMEIVNKFQWLGVLMQWIISAFSIFGLCLVIYQRLVSILYLTNRPFFDSVAELKDDSHQSAFFGFPGMAKDVWTGKRGMGLDAIIGFFLMLVPNVREYSDYKSNATVKNLNREEDDVLGYVLKTLPSTVFIVLFLTCGFSGTLMRGYGMLVDGLAVAADTLVEVNFEGWVKKTLSKGDGHSFTLGADGSATGEFGEDIARDLYSKVVSRLDVVDENTKLIIGRDCEQWVIDNVLGGSNDPQTRIARINEIAQTAAIEGASDTLSTQIRTDADVKSAKFDIKVNNMEKMGASEGDGVGVSVALSELVENAGLAAGSENESNNLYMHLMITKGKVSHANYFAPAESGSGSGTSTTNK